MPDNRYGHNPSGAQDPTPTKAVAAIQREDKRVSDFIHFVRYLADNCGFSIEGRIILMDKRTGRIFK